jgi:D-arabinose 1-dehydrogenase-like Zn-dependent alcohol dehydrogenase
LPTATHALEEAENVLNQLEEGKVIGRAVLTP